MKISEKLRKWKNGVPLNTLEDFRVDEDGLETSVQEFPYALFGYCVNKIPSS